MFPLSRPLHWKIVGYIFFSPSVSQINQSVKTEKDLEFFTFTLWVPRRSPTKPVISSDIFNESVLFGNVTVSNTFTGPERTQAITTGFSE